MKKYILILLSALLSLSSCTDKDDIDISCETTMTVTAAHIFSGYQIENMSDLSNSEGWKVRVYTFIYDESGKIIQKTDETSENLQAEFKLKLNLAQGNYKMVSIATFEDEEIRYWDITHTDDIKTLTISEIEENPIGSIYETLGVDLRDLTVDGKSTDEKIFINPLTSLVQIEFHMRQIVEKYDGTYGFKTQYHRWINTFTFSGINQKTNCNQVRFSDGQIKCGYQTQNSNYQMAGLLTSDAISLNKGTIYSYRALLPQKDKEFSWFYHLEWNGQPLIEESTGTGTDSGYLQIEAGQQYDLDMFYDVMYLYASKHNSSISAETRLKEAMKYVPEWCAPDKE